MFSAFPVVSGGAFEDDGNTLYVDANNGDDDTGNGTVLKPYATIKKAVGEASDGDTISVNPGTYRETIGVGKSITIRSTFMSPGNTSVEAPSSGADVFSITGDWVNLTGFTIGGYTNTEADSAVQISSGKHCTVSGNVIKDSRYGVFLYENCEYNAIENNSVDNCDRGIDLYRYATGNRVVNNTVDSSYYNGIEINYYSDDNFISGNTVRGNTKGIYATHHSEGNRIDNNTVRNNERGITIDRCEDFTLRDNNITGNDYNFGIGGSEEEHYRHDIDPSNYVDGGGVRYWIDRQNSTAPTDAGYFAAIACDNITVRNLSVRHNTDGVLFVNTHDSRIINVTAADCQFGIHIKNGENIELRQCTVSGSAQHNAVGGRGIYLENSIDSVIVDSTARGNELAGIELGGHSTGNRISRNTVESNEGFGISVGDNCDDCIVEDNTAKENSYGIMLSRADDAVLRNNSADDNTQEGIYIFSCEETHLDNNSAAGNGETGILLSRSAEAHLTNNSMQDNGVDFDIYGLYVEEYYHEIDDSNIVGSGSIYYWFDRHDEVITGDDVAFVMVVDSTNITIRDLSFEGMSTGIMLLNIHDSLIENITASGNSVGVKLMDCGNIILRDIVANENDDYGILLESSEHNELRNITANDNGDFGIYVRSDSDYTTIESCTADDNYYQGIYLSYSDHSTVTKCRAFDNGQNGILLLQSLDNHVYGNTVTGNGNGGIKLNYHCSDNMVENNSAANNVGSGLVITENSEENTLMYNTVVGNNAAGIMVERWSESNTVFNNIVTGNDDAGITIYCASKSNSVVNNTITKNNGAGIVVDYLSESNSVVNNTITKNDGAGIAIDRVSYSNTLANNTVTGNDGAGIHIRSSSVDNLIYNNFFINDANAIDDSGGSNRWNTTKTTGENIIGGEFIAGNFWSDYAGRDNDGDGLGDTGLPYNASGGIENGGDHQPLFYPIPVFELNKTVNRTTGQPGETVKFNMTIRNVGTENATNVTVAESYGEYIEFVSADPAPDSSGNNDTWLVPRLGINETFLISVTIMLSDELLDGSYVINRVDVTCDQGIEKWAEERVDIVAPLLFVMKTDDPHVVENGSLVVYTIDIMNFGSRAASNVTVIETYDDNVTFVEADPEPTEGNHTWNLGTLPDHTSIQIELTARVNDAVPNGTVIFNNVSVSCDEGFSTYAVSYTSVIFDEPPRDVSATIDAILGLVEPDGIITVEGTIVSDPPGTVESVDLYLNESHLASALFTNVDFNGTINLPTSLPEGNHTIGVEVRFESGEIAWENVSIAYEKEPEAVVHIISIFIDPISSDITPGAPLTISGNISVDPVDAEGAVREGRIFLDGVQVGNATVDGPEFIAIIGLPTDLDNGNHTITVNVTLHSNESAEEETSILYEKEEPVVRTISITIEEPSAKIGPGKQVAFLVTILIDPPSVIREKRVYLDGEQIDHENDSVDTIPGGFRWLINITLPSTLTEGTHTFIFNITLVTAESAEENREFTYTPEAPSDDKEVDDTSGDMGGAQLIGVVVIVIVVLLVILMKMGFISRDGTMKSEEEKNTQGMPGSIPDDEREPDKESETKPMEKMGKQILK